MNKRIKDSSSPLMIRDEIEIIRNIYYFKGNNLGHILYVRKGEQGIIVDIFTMKQLGYPPNMGILYAKVKMNDGRDCKIKLSCLKRVNFL